MADTLRRARGLVERGWSEPLSQVEGKWCFAPYPGQTKWSVEDALRVSATSTDELLEAREVLEQTHHPILYAAELYAAQLPKEPGEVRNEQLREYAQIVRASVVAKETYLDFWLQRSWRTPADVLRLFDLAILRASAREAA